MSILLVHRNDAKGWISPKKGVRLDLVRVGDTLYFKPDGGRLWHKVSARNPRVNALASITLGITFTVGPLGPHAEFVNAGETTYHGRKAIQLRNKSSKAIFLVAATGQPYPLAFVGGRGNHVTITFDRWNQPVTLKPPKNAINISTAKQGHTA